MAIATSYVIENDAIFQRKIKETGRQFRDLRIPLTLIARDFFKSQRSIFKLKGPGQYPVISIRTAEEKISLGISPYPLLVRTGLLRDSMTKPSHPMAVNEIINKKELLLGTKVEYGIHHQFGAPAINLPMRKFLFIGPEAPRFALNEQIGRLERWINIFDSFIAATLRKNFKPTPAGSIK